MLKISKVPRLATGSPLSLQPFQAGYCWKALFSELFSGNAEQNLFSFTPSHFSASVRTHWGEKAPYGSCSRDEDFIFLCGGGFAGVTSPSQAVIGPQKVRSHKKVCTTLTQKGPHRISLFHLECSVHFCTSQLGKAAPAASLSGAHSWE